MAEGEVKYKVVIDDDGVEGQLKKSESKISNVASGAGKAFLGMAAAVGTAAVAAGAAAFKVGVDWESAFAGVKKTVDGTDAEIAELENGILDMAKSVPIAATEIAGIAEAAGQLGIKNENILGFTRVMADLGVATNMTSEQAATSLARLANITQMPQENFDRLGSSVVALGNNMATTESEIVDMSLRLAGAANTAGFSEAEMMGLSAALSSVGVEAQAGGGAMSRVLNDIDNAAKKGGSSVAGFAEIAGVSASDFSKMWGEDAAGAFDLFVQGLGKVQEEGGSVAATLEQVGITSTIDVMALTNLAGAGDLLSTAIGVSNDAWQENSALTNEAAQRYVTMESQIQLLKNRFTDMGITIYQGMQEPLGEALAAFTEMIDVISSDGTLDLLTESIASLGTTLVGAIVDILPIIIDLINSLLPPILELVDAVLPVLLSIIESLMPVIQMLAETVFPVLVDLLNVFLEPIKELIDGLLPPLVELFNSVIEPLMQLVEAVLPVLVSLFDLLVTPIIQLVEELMPLFLEIFNAVIDPLTQIIEEILPILIELFENIIPPLMRIVEALLPPLLELFKAIITPIMTIIKSLLPPLIELFNLLIPPILQIIEALLPPLISLFEEITKKMEFLTPVIDTLANYMKDILGAAIDFLSPIIDNFKSYLQGLIDFITGVFTGDWGKAWNGLVQMFKGILNQIPSIVEGILNGAIGVINGLINGINSISSKVGIPAIPNIPNVSIPRFHVGGVIEFEGGAEEGTIIARRGEMVLTEAQQAEVWKILNQGGDPDTSTPVDVSVYNNLKGTVVLDGRVVGQVVWENLDDVTAFQ